MEELIQGQLSGLNDRKVLHQMTIKRCTTDDGVIRAKVAEVTALSALPNAVSAGADRVVVAPAAVDPPSVTAPPCAIQ